MKLKEEVLRKRSSKLHLDDLILIMKCLYPSRVVENPYEVEIYRQKSWSKRERLLVSQLVYASCLLNQRYRVQNEWQALQASREDYINALELAGRELSVAKPSLLLPCNYRRMLISIRELYGREVFTNRKLRIATEMSKSHIQRSICELKSYGLLEIVSSKNKYKGYTYRLTEKGLSGS